MFWVNEGPSFGALYITPNGKDYLEFFNVKFHYNKLIYIKKYDIYYPCDIELIGKLDDKKISLRFWSKTESYEYIDPFKENKFYKAWILCEMPGQMKGIYRDSENIIKLKGDCKIVPLRLPSALGHNSIRFDFLYPPNGIGINILFDSHYLRKKVYTSLKFAPKLLLKIRIKKIKEDDFSK